MRKFSKVALIVAAVTGATGLAMTISGVSMGATIAGLDIAKNGGWGNVVRKMVKTAVLEDNGTWEEDWDKIDQMQSSEQKKDSEIYLADAISDLKLSLSTDELTFSEYDGKQIRIEITGDKKDKVRVGKDDGGLIVEAIGHPKDRSIQIMYPKGYEFGETSIDLAAGTVQINDEFLADEMELSVAAGEITNTGKIRAKDITIDVATGNVELENVDTKKLEGDCSVGNIELGMTGQEKDYNYDISCGAGSVQIGDNSFEGVGSEKKINNPGADGELTLDCSVGNISVDFMEA